MALYSAVANTPGNGSRVGSVGAVGSLEYDRRNARIKGIVREVVRTKDGLSAVFGRVSAAENKHPRATRTTFRAFVDRGLVENIRSAQRLAEREGLTISDRHLRVDKMTDLFLLPVRQQMQALGIELHGYSMEAVIPTNGAVEGCDLVYFGRNRPTRTPSRELQNAEQNSLFSVQAGAHRVGRADAIARATGRGYELSQMGSPWSNEDAKVLLNLYNEAYQLYTFEISETTIRSMAGNGNKVLVARDAAGSIASVLIAEECTLELSEGQRVAMYELSDFATFRKDRSNGLMTALQIEAVRLLRSIDPHAIIYAEDRAPWIAVNKSSKEAGLECGGTLSFHCALISDRNFEYNGGNHQYESLNVWYAPFNGRTASGQ